jgi:hypothetical protein
MATPRTGRPHGGARAGAGRPRGSKTKIYRPHAEKVLAAAGIMPLQVMLDVMRRHHRSRRYNEAARVAAMAAPYVHARLNSTAVTVKRSLAEEVISLSDEELAAHVAELEALAGISSDVSDEEKEELLGRVKPRGNA